MKKILVANRGEIAVRIIRTCRELGLSTVAVYSEPDRDALHVRFADEAFALGGRTAAESYLNSDAILDLMERSGADGVHPGYGFLSENAEFAQAVIDRGVVFVGPPPGAIATMGDKISARRAAEDADVPVLPGGAGALSSVAELVGFGESHGWPVAVKAAFGGGGRGMKVVASAGEASAAMESARREAVAYFGRPELYAERFLTRPRHIEMQVLADTYGNVVWLGERDCSVQRRHQKLIEESPAPDFPDHVRRAMGEAGVRLARACSYVGVGTVEFLYQDEEFYFLEMNTRLQVEHPVTELVTGLDLVEWQLRVAGGGALGFGQADVRSTGHAIEVRVNAEDPAGGRFAPSPGTLTAFVSPTGPGVRVDAGYVAGDAVSPFYDNLVAKVVVWAQDRDRARRRMVRALGETEIAGVATTIPAQVAIVEHPDFVAARHSTNWVDHELDLSPLDSAGPTSSDQPGGVPQELPELTAEIGGQRFALKLWTSDPRGLAASLGLTPAPAADAGTKRADWRSRRGVPSVTTWSHAGATRDSGSARERPAARDAQQVRHSPGRILAPMHGTVVRMLVEVGDRVSEHEEICVIEAMKMESVVAADVAGSVTEILVSPGETVDSGRLIAVISE
ncbi:biotin carboxylase N-terminal domain-containing protein [Dactylosporangium sp. AC04546]|nr:biotin carboxylase N-terminal domain-containing protein [Dactylosporangium sp. AC04546]WVK89585.1 biotin carboxylase N-terminal domain-containing protein [Dactylosporangium sp. AC04546]